MTIEKIFEIRDELVKQGIIDKPKIDDSVFLKLFEELKEWFKWDIQRFPYKELTDEAGEFYNYEDRDLKFYNENYDLIVFSTMVGLIICEKKGVLNSITRTNAKLSFMFSGINNLEDEWFYKNYQKICGIDTNILDYFVKGTIRNKIGNGTFEEFLNNYTAILQKYKNYTPVINNDGVIETTATPVVPVAPTYQITHHNPNQDVIDKYGYVPAAVEALQQNTIGLWYYDQQSSIFRSKLVDYSKLDNCHDQKAVKLYIEHITRVMSMPKVYQMILQEMPELGTKINGNTIKFKIAGYSASKIELLAMKDDEHVLAIIYDVVEDKAQGISGDKKNVDEWTAKKLAD